MIYLKHQASSSSTKCPVCKTETDCSVSPGKLVKFLNPIVHLDRLWCTSCGKKFYARAKAKNLLTVSR